MGKFANKLAAWMAHMGYNAPAAAAALGVTAPTIRNWLSGRENPHSKAFLALMEKINGRS